MNVKYYARVRVNFLVESWAKFNASEGAIASTKSQQLLLVSVM